MRSEHLTIQQVGVLVLTESADDRAQPILRNHAIVICEGKKLTFGDHSAPIRTVRGIGYRLDVP